MLCCRPRRDCGCTVGGGGGAPLSCGHLGSCRRFLANADVGEGDGVVARMLWDLDSLEDAEVDAEEETKPEAMSRR